MSNVVSSTNEADGATGDLSEQMKKVTLAGADSDNQPRRQRGSSSGTEMEPNNTVHTVNAKPTTTIFPERSGVPLHERVAPTRISETLLRELASQLGKNWQALGIHLGFKSSNLDSFRNASPSNSVVYQMLNLWEQRTDALTQKPALVYALVKAGRTDISDEMANNLIAGEPVPETTLHLLSTKIGGQWKTLATYLGITSDEIDGIKEDNQTHSLQDTAFDMLVEWDTRCGEENNINYLQDKLKTIGRTDLATHKDLWTNIQ